MKTKLSSRFWAALVLFGLIGQVAWVVENMYFNVFIYKMFRASAADISLMVSASAIAATLTTVLIGALADRIGKRKLFICGGYILWGISIFSFVFLRLDVIEALFPMTASAAAIGVSLVIIMDCVMTFFGSSANDAAFNAWVTDSTDSTNRGAAEGINSTMPLLAILVVFGGFMFFDLNESSSWTWIFSIIGAVVLVIGVLGFFLIKDTELAPSKTGYFANILYGFRPSTIKSNPILYLALIGFALFNCSIQIFMPYLILYYEVSLELSDYVLIMAPAILIAAVVTAFWGRVYDKKGFGFSLIFSMISLGAGYILLYLFRSTALVFVGSLLMMIGYLASMAVFGAKIRDCTPAGKAGMLQGVRIFSQVLIPGIIGPSIGAAVLADAEQIVNNDGTTSFVPNNLIFLAALIALLTVIPLALLIAKKRSKPTFVELSTVWEEELGNQTPWSEYPRPQMKRDSFFCLNGKWNFKIRSADGERTCGEILVPFPVESHLSGVMETVKPDDTMVYSRSFILNEEFLKDRLLLHFGAVDQECTVWINGKEAGHHIGGYLPFTFDITDLAAVGNNEIVVEVKDPLDTALPYGKQSKKRGGMWYRPTSGIWQTVWMESVCDRAIRSLKITPSLDSVTIEVEGGEEEKLLRLGEREIRFTGESVTVEIQDPIHWSPEYPHLYDFTITSGADTVQSYFALRTIEIAGDKILLNGKPYFFHGLLDQGYFSDGIYLPASEQGFGYDICKMKELGFNTLRKHIKIEPDIFYHYCDQYGMIVFQDLVNSGKYHFLLDTALPTIGLKKGISHHASEKRRRYFEESAKETLALLYNHPCVCYYTLFNEGWGQYDAKRLFGEMKQADSTRVWDATSGWFQTGKSDVLSEHVYFKPIKLKSDGRPLVLSEFGGYSCKIKGHSFNLDKTYGYRFFEDDEKFKRALTKLYCDEIIPAIENGLCGAILTQVSDVEDETNGLLTYDRKVCKVEPATMQQLAKDLHHAFAEKWAEQ